MERSRAIFRKLFSHKGPAKFEVFQKPYASIVSKWTVAHSYFSQREPFRSYSMVQSYTCMYIINISWYERKFTWLLARTCMYKYAVHILEIFQIWLELFENSFGILLRSYPQLLSYGCVSDRIANAQFQNFHAQMITGFMWFRCWPKGFFFSSKSRVCIFEMHCSIVPSKPR